MLRVFNKLSLLWMFGTHTSPNPALGQLWQFLSCLQFSQSWIWGVPSLYELPFLRYFAMHILEGGRLNSLAAVVQKVPLGRKPGWVWGLTLSVSLLLVTTVNFMHCIQFYSFMARALICYQLLYHDQKQKSPSFVCLYFHFIHSQNSI